MNGFSKFIDQLSHNAAKQPGWVPLLILIYFVLPFAGLPDKVFIAGRTISLSDELWAAALTLALFLLGDALDKGIYKPLEKRVAPKGFEQARIDARTTFRIHDGVYDVTKGLASAAELYQSFSIQFLNESAKLLRSLILPAVIAGFCLIALGRLQLGMLLIIGGGLLIPLYAFLKATHIRNLYHLVPALNSDRNCHIEDVGGMRLFFWEGVLAGSALTRLPRNAVSHHEC